MNRSTCQSARMSSSAAGSCAARPRAGPRVGGRSPASSPSTAGRRSSSQSVASAFTSRWPAFGSTTVRLEWASWAIVRQTSSRTMIPLPPPWTVGPAREVELAALDERGVGAREVRPQVEQRVEGAGARLLLALDEVADAAGERPERVAVRLQRPDPRQELALVVGGAAAPRPGRRGSRARTAGGPQVERRGGLDVVVARRLPACAARRPARRRRAAARLAQLERPRRRSRRGAGGRRSSRPRAAQVGAVAALGRDAAELDQLLDPASMRSSTMRVEAREVGRRLGAGAGRGAGLRRSCALAREVEERQLDDRGVDPAAAALDRPLHLEPGARSARSAAARRRARCACLRIGLQPCEVALPTWRAAGEDRDRRAVDVRRDARAAGPGRRTGPRCRTSRAGGRPGAAPGRPRPDSAWSARRPT